MADVIKTPRAFDLTDNEQNIFYLLEYARKVHAPDVTLRVAGGWVRDKLLGNGSHDIDIAIDGMSGATFAHLVLDLMQRTGMTSKLTVMAARPEQSKHLETALLTIHGQAIDFAQLRKENYANTRIPEIECGTPEEDANRRDLTINSLFLNLDTDEVEDWTGRGLDDLMKRVADTPIDAVQTFLDDPLRILRTVRFAMRFALVLDHGIIEAAQREDVQQAFKDKVSKERIWMEMVGQQEPDGWKEGFLLINPHTSLKMIDTLGFRDVLFIPPNSNLNPWDMDQGSSHHDLHVWGHTIAAMQALYSYFPVPEDPVERAVRHLAVLCHDLGKLDPDIKTLHEDGIHYQYKGHEASSADLADTLLRELTAPNDIRERVVRLVREHLRFFNLPVSVTARTLRRIIRDTEDDWQHLVDICSADAMGKDRILNAEEIVLPLEHFRVRMKELYDEMGQPKPVRPVNGRDLLELGIDSGPQMGKFFRELDEMLLDEPDMTHDTALEFAKRFFEKVI
jgi:tRNA nucleotidyltransferase/poly(A) polymerase